MRDTETLLERPHGASRPEAGCGRSAGPTGMRRAPTPGRGPRHGPAAARRRGGRTAAQPAPAPGRGSKVRGAAATPPEFPPRARSQPRPSPVAGPGPWAEGTGGSRRHLPAAPRPHSALAGRDSEALGRTSPPPTHAQPRHLHPRVWRGPAAPVSPGSPNFLLPAPHRRSPQRPALSQACRERAPTSGSRRHRRCQAARLPGPAPPPSGPAPCGLPASGHRPPPSSARRLARVRHVTWVRRAEGAGKASAGAPRGGALHRGGCWEALFERSGAWRHLEVVVLNAMPGGRAQTLRSRPCEGSWSRSPTEAARKRCPRTPRCPLVFLQ